MKKYLLNIALFAMLSSCCFTFTACGDDKDDKIDDPSNPSTPSTPTKKDALSPIEQKERLESIAINFTNTVPASDFKSLKNDIEAVAETDFDRWDADEVEDWYEKILDDMLTELGTTTKKTETENWYGTTYIYNYFYTNYKAVILASNFTGHFTASGREWNYSKANDLQFSFPDSKGAQCIAKLETSGSVKKVHLLNYDEWDDYDSSHSGYTHVYNEYYDRVQCTIGVPEKIVLTLNRNGATLVKSTINIDLSNIVNEEFDIAKSSLNTSATVELNNGYKVEVSKVAYSANKSASASATVKKGSKSLMSFSLSSDLSGIPSCNVTAFEDLDEDDADYVNAKNAYVKFDVLGEMQMQGKISDIRKFADYLDAAEDYDEDEKNFKSYVNQANSLMDVNLFYDNKSTKQAAIKLESFCDKDYRSEYWYCEPVINFYDGSSYSTFEAFFNETDFKRAIRAFENLLEDYEDMIDY